MHSICTCMIMYDYIYIYIFYITCIILAGIIQLKIDFFPGHVSMRSANCKHAWLRFRKKPGAPRDGSLRCLTRCHGHGFKYETRCLNLNICESSIFFWVFFHTLSYFTDLYTKHSTLVCCNVICLNLEAWGPKVSWYLLGFEHWVLPESILSLCLW